MVLKPLKEACAEVGVAYTTVHYWYTRGKLPSAQRIGRTIAIEPEELKKIVESGGIKTTKRDLEGRKGGQ